MTEVKAMFGDRVTVERDYDGDIRLDIVDSDSSLSNHVYLKPKQARKLLKALKRV